MFLRPGMQGFHPFPILFQSLVFRWKRELSVFTSNWPLEENKFLAGKSFESKRFVNVLIKSKDHGSVLRPEILDEIQSRLFLLAKLFSYS
jgi:hypothetical protein